MTVFCKIPVPRSKNCLEFLIAGRRLKISISGPFMYNSKKLPTINLLNFTPKVKLFFVEKGNLKFSDEKM